MTRTYKIIKGWSYIKLQRKILKMQKKGWSYDINTGYKNWIGKRCVKMYKDFSNG
jgi:hypothetical protein